MRQPTVTRIQKKLQAHVNKLMRKRIISDEPLQRSNDKLLYNNFKYFFITTFDRINKTLNITNNIFVTLSSEFPPLKFVKLKW